MRRASRRWFIYVLRCPISWEVRYVGKTTDPRGRLTAHLSGAPRKRYHTARWIASLRRLGTAPLMEIIEAGLGNGHGAAERAWIAEYKRRGAKLTNITKGGDGGWDGVKQSPEHVAKKAAANRGKKRSPEARARISERQRGKVISPEHRAKLAAAGRGRTITKAAREKLAAANRGKKLSDETRARISAANKNRAPEVYERMAATKRGSKHSPETRSKMSAAHSGKRFSEATREKMSAAQRGKKHSEATREKLALIASQRTSTKRTPASKSRPRNEEARRARLLKTLRPYELARPKQLALTSTGEDG